MLVLGIETSCDETGLALVEDGKKILGAQLSSSLKQHQPYGGVVPEIASRAHVEVFTYELEQLMAAAGVGPDGVDRIAVTWGPGLAGCLVAGVAAAKALALVWKKELVGVNHLQAHLYAALMQEAGCSIDTQAIGLVISGGHTAIIRMEGIHRFTLLGQTRDDAVGEAFDKVAKLLGLGFPGGPEIQRVAPKGNPKAYRFSPPKIKGGSAFDFSLSGIKTAVMYKVKEKSPDLSPEKLDRQFVADMAASFQTAVVEEVVDKTLTACHQYGISKVVVGGGVIANQHLRERLKLSCEETHITCAIPPMSLCTDNGAMVAGLGAHLKPLKPSEITAIPDLGLGGS